jgi:hypothetical protein
VTAAAPPLPPVLPALRALFQGLGADRLPTEAVVAALAERLGGAPITATRLARTLKPYGVAPRQFRVSGSGRRVWGYCLHDLPAAPVESRDTAPPAESRDTPKGAGGAAAGRHHHAGSRQRPRCPAASGRRAGVGDVAGDDGGPPALTPAGRGGFLGQYARARGSSASHRWGADARRCMRGPCRHRRRTAQAMREAEDEADQGEAALPLWASLWVCNEVLGERHDRSMLYSARRADGVSSV